MVKVKKPGQAIRKEQLIDLYRKEIYVAPEVPILPAEHFVPSISK